jgi:hypothetical protein
MSHAKPSHEQHKTRQIGTSPRANRRRGRLRRAVAIAAALAGVALLTAACGGGSASTTTPPASQGGTDAADYTAAVAYTQCMRAHGVPNFPDPDPSTLAVGKPFGGATLAQAGVNLNTPQAQAASTACQHLMPPGPSPAQRQLLLSEMLRYAACMRAHGLPNFPDPSTTPGGGYSLGLTPGVVSSPQFQPAEQACHSVAPGLPVPSGRQLSKGTP